MQFCNPSRPFSPRDGPRKSDIGLGGGGGVWGSNFLLRNVSQNPKKVNDFRRNRREKKNKNYLLFCSTLVVGCTKNAFYTTIQAPNWPPRFLFDSKMFSKNCRKLSHEENYLIICFLGFGSNKYYFSTKSSEKGPKNASNFAKIISRKNYLIMCFLAVSRSNWLKKWNRHLTDFSAPKHPQKVSQKTKKGKYFSAKPTGKKNYYIFFVRHWWLSGPNRVLHDYTSVILTSPFSVWLQKVLQKLPEIVSRKNYLIICSFWVWFEQIQFFHKIVWKRSQNGSNFAKIVSQKTYLIIWFLAVSRSNWLKKWDRRLIIFLWLRNTPKPCLRRPNK